MRQLAKEFPTKYTEAFLAKLQTTMEGLHEAWGNGTSKEFLRRPTSRGTVHMARLDPAMLVTPPAGKDGHDPFRDALYLLPSHIKVVLIRKGYGRLGKGGR